MSLRNELIQFIKTDLGANVATVDENTNLIDNGILDSMALMRLMDFVEDRTGVRVPDSEVVPDNFQTVAEIETLVNRIRSR
jgi:acyl carrier protein